MLTGVSYLSAVLLVLELDRPLTAKYWLNIADNEMPFVGVIEHTNMIDKSLYGGGTSSTSATIPTATATCTRWNRQSCWISLYRTCAS